MKKNDFFKKIENLIKKNSNIENIDFNFGPKTFFIPCPQINFDNVRNNLKIEHISYENVIPPSPIPMTHNLRKEYDKLEEILNEMSMPDYKQNKQGYGRISESRLKDLFSAIMLWSLKKYSLHPQNCKLILPEIKDSRVLDINEKNPVKEVLEHVFARIYETYYDNENKYTVEHTKRIRNEFFAKYFDNCIDWHDD